MNFGPSPFPWSPPPPAAHISRSLDCHQSRIVTSVESVTPYTGQQHTIAARPWMTLLSWPARRATNIYCGTVARGAWREGGKCAPCRQWTRSTENPSVRGGRRQRCTDLGDKSACRLTSTELCFHICRLWMWMIQSCRSLVNLERRAYNGIWGRVPLQSGSRANVSWFAAYATRDQRYRNGTTEPSRVAAEWLKKP